MPAHRFRSALTWTAILYVPFAFLGWWLGNPHGPLSGSFKAVGFLLGLPFWSAYGAANRVAGETIALVAGFLAWFVCLFAVVLTVHILFVRQHAKPEIAP